MKRSALILLCLAAAAVPGPIAADAGLPEALAGAESDSAAVESLAPGDPIPSSSLIPATGFS